MPTPPLESLFPLTYCPACGYALTGLPNSGRCPECGTPYDNANLVLFGWPPANFQSPGANTIYIAALCVAIFLAAYAAIGLVAVIASLALGLWQNAAFAMLFAFPYAAAAAALLFVARWARRRKLRRSLNPLSCGKPTLQLHLANHGYALRRGFGPIQFLHWIPNLEIDLAHQDTLAILRIARLTPVGNIDWSTLVHIAFPANPEQYAAFSTYFQALRQIPPE